jgi:hypothetical protein
MSYGDGGYYPSQGSASLGENETQDGSWTPEGGFQFNSDFEAPGDPGFGVGLTYAEPTQGNNYSGGFSQPIWSPTVSGVPSGSGGRITNGGNGGGGGGGYGGRSGSFNTIVSNAISYGDLPKVPEYDENKVRGLRQKYAAPGISKLRSAVSEAVTKSMSVDNPYLRKTLLKSSMEGFGGGLESVMTGAETMGRNAYDTEYKGKLIGYNAEVNRQNKIFEAAMRGFNVGTGSVAASSDNTLGDVNNRLMQKNRIR